MVRKSRTLPDFRKIFERGFALREARTDADWHSEPSIDEFSLTPRWHWHASSLGDCVRAAVLKRASLAPDPTTVDSNMAFEFGHTMHSALEEFLKAGALFDGSGDWTVDSVEAGGAHPTLPLKAKPDAILKCGAEFVPFDFKTEGGTALRIRTSNQKSEGAADSVSPAHKLQVTAGAMCSEARNEIKKVKRGIVCYCSRREGKNLWDFDSQEFVIDDALRAQVTAKLSELDQAWNAYQLAGTLPPRLPAEPQFYGGVGPNWRCRAVGPGIDAGKFCAARSVCMALPPTPEPEQLGTVK